MDKEKEPEKPVVSATRAPFKKNHTSQPMAAPSDEQIKERIQDIVLPATLAQVSYFHRLGLRERTLGFVVMVCVCT